MMERRNFRETLLFPLQAVEEIARAPADFLREGVSQLGQSAQESGFPKPPVPPALPKVFSRNPHNNPGSEY